MKLRIRKVVRLTARFAIFATGLISWTNTWAFINHEVKRGETLWGIAHHYGVSADDIIEYNPTVKNGLKNGITIRIPEKSDFDTQNDKTSVEYDTDNRETYDKVTPNTDNMVNDSATNEIPSYKMNSYLTSQVELPNTHANNAEGASTYVSRFGDTFSSIEAKTGVSETILVNLNPLVDGNNIPESEEIRLTAEAPQSTRNSILTTVDSIVYKVTPQDSKINSNKKEIGVAIMLPFELYQDEISRQALLATEFYKGFLLATKENGRSIDYELKIYTFDTSDDSQPIENTLERIAEEGITVVIPPDHDKQIEEIEEFCDAHGITVFNVLNIKDDGYMSHPNVVQCNINQKMMYDKAIEALEIFYPDYQPIILNLVGGKDEKSGFTQELKRRYEQKGIKVDELTFTDNLKESDLMDLTENKKFILIPKSGSQDVFEKISEAIAWTKESDLDPERVKLFGYPDWVAFRGQSEEELHRIGAVIYSRFNYDSADTRAGELNEKFKQWYGSQQIEVFPSQGTLGYDAGNMLYRMISAGWPDSTTGMNDRAFTGKQSSFRFVQNDSEGFINDTLYIIEFLPGNGTISKVI